MGQLRLLCKATVKDPGEAASVGAGAVIRGAVTCPLERPVSVLRWATTVRDGCRKEVTGGRVRIFQGGQGGGWAMLLVMEAVFAGEP